MTDDEIDEAARNDPDNPEWTDEELDRAVFARDVRQTREAIDLTQAEFAERFMIALARLRDWEQGRTVPDSVAIAYLKVIATSPRLVAKALRRQSMAAGKRKALQATRKRRPRAKKVA